MAMNNEIEKKIRERYAKSAIGGAGIILIRELGTYCCSIKNLLNCYSISLDLKLY